MEAFLSDFGPATVRYPKAEAKLMQGNRRPDRTRFRELHPGDYCKYPGPDGKAAWYFRTPGGQGGMLDVSSPHTVTEHEDGTITVSPSILQPVPDGWHGFLERGVWREC